MADVAAWLRAKEDAAREPFQSVEPTAPIAELRRGIEAGACVEFAEAVRTAEDERADVLAYTGLTAAGMAAGEFALDCDELLAFGRPVDNAAHEFIGVAVIDGHEWAIADDIDDSSAGVVLDGWEVGE